MSATPVPSSIYPLTVHFVKGRSTKVFSSQQDIIDWVAKEQNGWMPYLAGQSGGSININRNLLDGLANISDELVSQKLEQLKERYLPFETIGDLLAIIGDVNAAAQIIQEVLSPNSQQHPNQAFARAVGVIFRAYGSVLGLSTYLNETKADIEKIRGHSSKIFSEFQKQIITSKSELDKFKEDFQTEIALQAPRTYWEKRAKHHDEAAQKAGKMWTGALVILLLITLASLILLACGVFSLAVDGDINTKVFMLIERFAMAGTIFGFLVWWLRQKLRDLRAHEHLAEDAAERVTMIDTYNAMRSAGLQTNDLTAILTALYRPASTGFINDSGPVLPIEILLKSAVDVAATR